MIPDDVFCIVYCVLDVWMGNAYYRYTPMYEAINQLNNSEGKMKNQTLKSWTTILQTVIQMENVYLCKTG
jgi:hypothetical protein